MTFDELFEVRQHLQESVRMIENELLKTDWRHLANRGLTVLAIRAYRQSHNCAILEAKEMVESFKKFIS